MEKPLCRPESQVLGQAGCEEDDHATTFAEVQTDIKRWRLTVNEGRHLWHYLSAETATKQPLSFAEKWHLGIRTENVEQEKPATAVQAAENLLRFFTKLQLPSGHWACDFTGPNVDIPGIIIALYVTGLPLRSEEQAEIVRYVFNIQNEDGGWGLHIAGESTVYGTSLHYVALRLLGVPAEHPKMQEGRVVLERLGGIMQTPQIGKFWLCVLGVFNWDAMHPVIPDVWLLPEWTPIAPWRWWPYARIIFAALSFTWSKQWSYPWREKDPLIGDIREEVLYSRSETLEWSRFKNTVDEADNFHPQSWILTILYFLISMVYLPFIRTPSMARHAEEKAYRYMQIDDENTGYATIASIAAPMVLVARFIKEGRESSAVQMHLQRLRDFFWMTKRGMAINVTSGVQSWDTAFCLQAIVDAGLACRPEFQGAVQSALGFLGDNQLGHSWNFENSSAYSDPPTQNTSFDIGYRQARRGAWGFSEKAQGYPVSDCTGEALKAILRLQSLTKGDGSPQFIPALSRERVRWTVDILLLYQSNTGGCSCYEAKRGSALLEHLNPAQILDNLMVAYDYPECTSSCLTALQLFRQIDPSYRADEISRYIEACIGYIFQQQRPDGSWYGTWGICFTYAAYFTHQALASQGYTYSSSQRVRKACNFLLSKQRHDGGWGESYQSNVTGVWVDHPESSQVVQTAWALIALVQSAYPHKAPLAKGIALLMERQQANGEFLEEDVEGAHQKSCVLKYPNYRFVFGLQALGMYARRWEQEQV